MMLRLLMMVSVLAIGLAMPAAAQQVSDQEARQAAESFVESFLKAAQKKDAAGLATLYTEDAILILPEGPVSGRAAIERNRAEGFKVFSQETAKLDQVKVIGDGIRIRSGTWSGTLQSPNGPIPLKGNWATTDVRDGGIWKIRMEAVNMTPPPSK
jgi:uncharacterized protein (TIGR02246 family)